jgi:hypothetical protein
MIKKFVEILNRIIDQKLEAKTSWGRNEIKAALKDALTEAMMEMME